MSSERSGSDARALAVQIRVLRALIIRDMMMRYGRVNIGFLWVILEPMILTAAVMILWSLIKAPYQHGLAIVAIVLTGYMPLTLFRHVSGVGPHIFRHSIPLLYHRNITFIDSLLARCFLEFVGTTTALLAVYGVLVMADVLTPMKDPGLLLLGWVIMGLLAFGLAAIFGVMTEFSEVSERFIQPFQYMMLPVSGAFYMVEWLPKRTQDIAWYMPTTHCYEMFRAGYFGAEVIAHYNVWYPLLWALALTALGFSGIDKVRDRIHTG